MELCCKFWSCDIDWSYVVSLWSGDIDWSCVVSLWSGDIDWSYVVSFGHVGNMILLFWQR